VLVADELQRAYDKADMTSSRKSQPL
jgi:hypothetical protein